MEDLSTLYPIKEHDPTFIVPYDANEAERRRNHSYVNKEYQEYLDSKRWQCDKSPTSAHCWRQLTWMSSVWVCKYCNDTRHFPCTLEEALASIGNEPVSEQPPGR